MAGGGKILIFEHDGTGYPGVTSCHSGGSKHWCFTAPAGARIVLASGFVRATPITVWHMHGGTRKTRTMHVCHIVVEVPRRLSRLVV